MPAGQEDSQKPDTDTERPDDPPSDMSGALVGLIAWTFGVCLCVLVIVVTVKAVIWVCS